MTVIGIDDTDSRRRGMCTTYVAATLADRIADAGGRVDRTLLVRLNPAIEHKTRGNAALAVHCELAVGRARDLAADVLGMAALEDPRTSPGAVVADCQPAEVDGDVADFARRALHAVLSVDEARELVDAAGFEAVTPAGGTDTGAPSDASRPASRASSDDAGVRGTARGLVGALAAVGAWRAFDEWTYECISYRERERWGTERQVESDSVFAAAEAGYPRVWDTVDCEEGYAVCVPRTPCPVLHGIRGDDLDAVRTVADAIEGEPVASRHVFVTNQGTDAHLRRATPGSVADGGAYRVTGEVVAPPETRPGGHVFLEIAGEDGQHQCAAFEPTKRFRDRVRALRVGDRITACGEVAEGTLKLEKLAVRELVTTERVTPDCPECDRSMASAGRDQGYRCRDCGTSCESKVERELDRDLEPGWYEVPPCARRHVAKPLVRGGFDAPVHPER